MMINGKKEFIVYVGRTYVLALITNMPSLPYSNCPAQPSHPITFLFHRPSRIRSDTNETLGIARLARTSTI